MTDIFKLLDEEEDRLKRDMAKVLYRARMNCRPEFVDRMEKYMLKHDLLPLGPKAN